MTNAKKEQRLHMHITKDMLDDLQRISKEKNITLSSLVRMWISEKIMSEKDRRISSI